MTNTATNGVPPDMMADLREVCRQAIHGIVRDVNLLRRVEERADRIRQEIEARNGLLDIGADIIRDMRENRE